MDPKTSEFKARLEAEIARLELETSIEFVPVFLERSANYGSFRLLAGLLVSLLALGVFHLAGISWNVWVESALRLALGVGTYLLLGHERVFARCMPKRIKQAAVEDAARDIFIEEEVFATRQRSGVLILVSLFEHAVYVLADKGVHAKTAPETWSQLGLRLAEDFDHSQPGASFFQALEQLTEQLKGTFPPDAENPNELGDHLRSPKR